ncbi:hypothetical protein D1BOALGB6SA_4549 [Olavius sp. associated proteobacterium Delta 1]|nr:hypothetical protein D1BOALGB6SA_4549 [Olavius sp. associated proteobacterium Delta 1]
MNCRTESVFIVNSGLVFNRPFATFFYTNSLNELKYSWRINCN